MHRTRCQRSSAWNRISVAALSYALVMLVSVACSAQSTLSEPELPAGLPDVLAMSDGARITTPAQWQAHRAQLCSRSPSRNTALRHLVPKTCALWLWMIPATPWVGRRPANR